MQAPNLRQVQLHQMCSCCVTPPPAASGSESPITGHGYALTTVRRAPAVVPYLVMSNVPTLHFARQPDHVGAMCVYRVHHVPVAEELSYHLEARSHGSWYLLGRCLAASSLCHFSLPMARGLRGKSRYMSKPEVKAAADSLRGLQSLRWCVMCGMCLQGVCLCVDSPTLSLFVHVPQHVQATEMSHRIELIFSFLQCCTHIRVILVRHSNLCQCLLD